MEEYSTLKSKLDQILLPRLTTVRPTAVQLSNIANLNWNNPLAIQMVYQTMVILGSPTVLTDDQNGNDGMALWDHVTSISGAGKCTVIIEDKAHVHYPGMTHTDFYYLTIEKLLKPQGVQLLPQLTGSTTYNTINNRLTAGCHFLGADIATIAVVKMLNDEILTLEQARSAYSSYTRECHEEYKALEDSGNFSNWRNYMPITIALDEYIFS